MKRLLSKSIVLAVAALTFATWGATPASAASAGAAVLTGTVTPDPALTAAGNPGANFGVDVAMEGTAVGVVGTSVATCDIDYSSSGTTNVALGGGTGNLDCNGAFVTGGSVSVSCSSPYLQVGPVVVLQGGTCTGTVGGSLTAACVIQVATTIIAAECAFAIV